VKVQPADPQWQRLGERLREELNVALSRWLAAPIQHVGSTAVPGLPAKPVLDLQAAVSDLGCAPAVAEALAGNGWHLVPPELDARPWRRFLVQAVGDVRVAHLHLMAVGSERWVEQLAFRDALRAEPVLRQRYAAFKQDWRLTTPMTGRPTPQPRLTSSAPRWADARRDTAASRNGSHQADSSRSA